MLYDLGPADQTGHDDSERNTSLLTRSRDHGQEREDIDRFATAAQQPSMSEF